MKEITAKQKELLDFYIALSEETGRKPSVTELSEKYGKSRSTVYETLLSLERKGYLERDNGTFVLPEKERTENTLLRIPLYQNADMLERDEVMDTILLPRSLGVDDNSFALLNHTDEMIGSGIVPGDTLIFHKGEVVENEKIVIAAIRGEDEKIIHVLRRYNERNGIIELIPDNDSIGKITTHECWILGILALKLRKY